MTRKLVIESSEKGRTEIDYSSLGVREITRRIAAYERKYGDNFEEFFHTYDCDAASPQEITDCMDWENLVAELEDRKPKPARKNLVNNKRT